MENLVVCTRGDQREALSHEPPAGGAGDRLHRERLTRACEDSRETAGAMAHRARAVKSACCVQVSGAVVPAASSGTGNRRGGSNP